MKNFYERKKLCSIREVFDFLGEDIDRSCNSKDFRKRIVREFEKDIYVRTNSQRYAVFKKSLKCSCCGLEGKYFALERTAIANPKSYHFNLYGIDKNGNEVMLTKDHIIPKSCGGTDNIENYQTMCVICNQKKGNRMEDKL
jgi:5-methylcytosine-specific restriction endonuclease McrA